jgi:ParB-like nuclease domain
MSSTYKVVPIDQIRANPRNTRTHSKRQIKQVAASMRSVGFAAPVLIDEHGVLLAGHARLEAAKSLGMTSVPAIVIDGLSDAQKRALLLADNRIALSAGWDRAQLAIELAALPELLIEAGLDISITGFEPAEIDILFSDYEDAAKDPADEVDASCLAGPAVTLSGDLWGLGTHRLFCGDARNCDNLTRVIAGQLAHMAFLDPPLQCCGQGHCGTRGRQASRVCDGVGRDVARGVHRLPAGDSRPRGQSLG